MEDLQTISAAKQADFCVELMRRLNIQRKQDHLCDITLMTKDDKEFKAHRNFLSAASPFLHKLVFLSRDYLLDVVTNELVRNNFGCLQLVSDAIKLSSFTSEAELPQSPRKGLETQAVVAWGGKYTFCYLPEKDKWRRLADGLSDKRDYESKVINFRDQLYTFSRYSCSEI